MEEALDEQMRCETQKEERKITFKLSQSQEIILQLYLNSLSPFLDNITFVGGIMRRWKKCMLLIPTSCCVQK